jgi:dihydroorotate dehydrogenase
MYKSIFRPILFLINPENTHNIIVFLLKFVNKIPGIKGLLKKCLSYERKSLETKIAGLDFRNKVGLAAGFDKNADFLNEFSVFGFSFIEIGTVTPLPQSGNVKPRLFRLPKDLALINRMGFNNKGVDYVVKLKNRDKAVIIGGNIGKNTLTSNENAADDYVLCFEKLYDVVDYFSVNVSCPNISGLEKLQDKEYLRVILGKLMKIRDTKQFKRPIFLKISPDLSFSQIDDILSLCKETGLDGIIATNTTNVRTGLSTNPEFIETAGQGGLSGKPLTKRAMEVVSYICKHTNGAVPVIGVGGIMNASDAISMLKAGACLVQIYTGFIYEGPFLVKRINKAIEKHLAQGC